MTMAFEKCLTSKSFSIYQNIIRVRFQWPKDPFLPFRLTFCYLFHRFWHSLSDGRFSVQHSFETLTDIFCLDQFVMRSKRPIYYCNDLSDVKRRSDLMRNNYKLCLNKFCCGRKKILNYRTSCTFYFSAFKYGQTKIKSCNFAFDIMIKPIQ